MALLRVENLSKTYTLQTGAFAWRPRRIDAVRDVSFSLSPATTLGIVGESGCGKSTLARMIMRLILPSAGRIYLNGENITQLSERRLRPLRKDFQIVFQDPAASLSPRLNVAQIIAEPMQAFGIAGPERAGRIKELLRSVNLPQEYARRLPRQLSGGERQRVSIARALSLRPKLLVLDEPVSALDVSTQAQLLNVLLELQSRYELTYLFIAHDLSVVRLLSDQVAVMDRGLIVEQAATEQLFSGPRHPYTIELLRSEPGNHTATAPDTRPDRRPDSATGCRYRGSCSSRAVRCTENSPELERCESGHWVRCFYP